MASSITHPGSNGTVDPGEPTEGIRYVARQPIMGLRGDVHGYELLFRAGPTTAFSGDGDAATRTVLDHTLIFGLDKLTGGLPVFVNCTREALVDGLVTVLPSGQAVLEILETLEPTAALLHACKELKASGFRLALDDFEWHEDWRPFVAIADYVKVDLSVTDAAKRTLLIEKVRGYSVRLVAERVETQEEFQRSRAEGFTLFQGYYFCRPVLLKNRDIPTNQLVHLELLQALLEYPLDTPRISNLVKRDASLTYRLLKLVNSALFGTHREIRSIQAALVIIGDEMFRRMATLAIATNLAGKHPMELIRMAFVRGRFCELAATHSGQDATEQYLLGIFSLLAAMLQIPMESIVKSLPMRPEIRQALLGEENAERSILNWLESYELADWKGCDNALRRSELAQPGLPEERLPQLYASAVTWAEDILSLR